MCLWWLIELISTSKVELIPRWWKGNFDVVCLVVLKANRVMILFAPVRT